MKQKQTQTQRADLWLPREKRGREGWEGLRALGQQVKLYRVDEQQGATLKHGTAFSIF